MSNPRYVLASDASETDRALYVATGLSSVVRDLYQHYTSCWWAEAEAAELCPADHHDVAGERIETQGRCAGDGPAAAVHRHTQSVLAGARKGYDALKQLDGIYRTGELVPEPVHEPRHRAPGEWETVRAELAGGRPASAAWGVLTPAARGLMDAADDAMARRGAPEAPAGPRYYGADDAAPEPDPGSAPGRSVHETKRFDAIRPAGGWRG